MEEVSHRVAGGGGGGEGSTFKVKSSICFLPMAQIEALVSSSVGRNLNLICEVAEQEEEEEGMLLTGT